MNSSKISDLAKLKFKVNQLKNGALKGNVAVLTITQIDASLEMGLCDLSDLDLLKPEWEKIRHDLVLRSEPNSPTLFDKVELLRLANEFGALWVESKSKDGDAKHAVLERMYRIWGRINYGISKKLITTADLRFNSPSEYFSVQRYMHEIEDLMTLFGEK